MPSKRLPCPPYNPRVKDLVEQRRKHSPAPSKEDRKAGFRGWFENGYLPHRDEPGLVQFVTFRLADSLPAHLDHEWQPLLQIEDKRAQHIKLENYLDTGKGKCHLRNRRIAELTEEALFYFHQQWYELRAWVIMPNHVHVLFKVGDIPLRRIVESWKSYTAKEANRILRKTGTFWQSGYWDTYIRDPEHERRTIRYIEHNPLKANLVKMAHDWQWSSARYQDNYRRLVIPSRQVPS
jgi:putative transposase